MTAVAGCIGPAADRLEIECEEILRAQSAYGGARASSAGIEGAFFGISLTPSLPEDRFDRQPLIVGDGRYLLVADVRLDNRDELALELNLDRRGKSDSDLLLQAWLRWQEACLDRIVGDFAIAVWDSTERRLTIARDPTGQRPLHFASNGPQVAFASMPSGLLAVDEFRRGFDRSCLALMLAGGGRNGDATYFSGVRRVLPGHIVQFTPSGARSWRHWNPPQEELRLADDGYVEAYQEKLRTAVLAHLRRDSGGVSVHLSSGFDSSAVAAMAARLSEGEKPVAFTSAPRAGFEGPVPRGRIADESGLAALTARMHRMEHRIVRSDRGALRGLREYCRHYQEPYVNLVNMTWARQISEDAVQRGAKVLLTGEMGNLTINAGGLPALAELVRAHRWGRWLNEATAAVRSGNARWRGVFVNSFRLPAPVRGILDRTYFGIPSASDQAFVRPEWLPGRKETPELYRGRYRQRFEQIAAYDIGLFRAGGLAEFGLHDRDPLADRRLLDFSFTLPPEQLLHTGVWRPLARRALVELVPGQVLESPLRGYQGADWYERFTQSEARGLLEEISSSSTAAELLDLPKIRSVVEHWPTEGWADPRTMLLYRARLPIALVTGVFLQEFESLVSADAG